MSHVTQLILTVVQHIQLFAIAIVSKMPANQRVLLQKVRNTLPKQKRNTVVFNKLMHILAGFKQASRQCTKMRPDTRTGCTIKNEKDASVQYCYCNSNACNIDTLVCSYSKAIKVKVSFAPFLFVVLLFLCTIRR